MFACRVHSTFLECCKSSPTLVADEVTPLVAGCTLADHQRHELLRVFDARERRNFLELHWCLSDVAATIGEVGASETINVGCFRQPQTIPVHHFNP